MESINRREDSIKITLQKLQDLISFNLSGSVFDIFLAPKKIDENVMHICASFCS